MKLSILLLIVGICAVSAKYLPEEWDDSDQSLTRFKRFDLGDSDISSEDDDDSDSKNDDSENLTDETDVKEQSKRVANLEKMRQKLLEKQEKERLKQEEAQRKIEEKIAKELHKEEEKRQKEQRKWEEKLEKERKKLEEEQRKIQEKIEENERKRQENAQKELQDVEKNKHENQESDSNSSNDDDSEDDSIELEDIWKIHIYSKYGITEQNTNVEKKAALRKYMQEELGLNANSTQSERRQAVLQFIQSELQKVPNIITLRSQFIDYINYVGVQKIRTKLEGDIEKLKNKTETLNNVNLSWAPIAKQNLAEQVSFLETIKQFLSNLLPNWFNGNTDKPQQGVPVTNAGSIISPDSGILTQQTNDNNTTNTINSKSNVIPSNIEVTVANSSPISVNNGSSVSPGSSVVSESSLIDVEQAKSLVDRINPSNHLSTVSEANSENPSTLETNETTITGNVDSVNKQSTSETGSDTVPKNSINEFNLNGDTTEVIRSDSITNESAQTGSTINSDVSVSDVNEKPSIASDGVNNVNHGDNNIAAFSPPESQSNPSASDVSVGDGTNQITNDNINIIVDAVNQNTESTTEYSYNEVSDAAAVITTDGPNSSSSMPSSDLSEASSAASNNNNENTGAATSIANDPSTVNIGATDVGTKKISTDTISEISPTVNNGAATSGLSGSDISETSLKSVSSDYIAPSGNTQDVSSNTSEGPKNVNIDAIKITPENNSTNINEINENSSTSNGIQTQVITETIEVITPTTVDNETSNVVNQEQSNPETSNTVQLIINEVSTAVTDQILAAETRQQGVSQASDLKTDWVTDETAVNTPVPIELGAAVVEVAQQ